MLACFLLSVKLLWIGRQEIRKSKKQPRKLITIKLQKIHYYQSCFIPSKKKNKYTLFLSFIDLFMKPEVVQTASSQLSI